MYQESRSVFRLELLLNILQLLRGYVQSPLHRQTFGGSHLHQSKLVFPALHLTTFAAHQFQLFAHLPIVAFVFAPDLVSCQFAFAVGKHEAQHFFTVMPYLFTSITSTLLLILFFILNLFLFV